MLIVLALSLALVQADSPASPLSSSPSSSCEQVLAAGVAGVAVEGCRGEEALRRGEAMSSLTGRAQQFQQAAQHFRQAASLSRDTALRKRLLHSLSIVLDRTHLDDSEGMEQILRELLTIDPYDLAIVARLARSQEDRGMFDAAENLLLTARAQQSDLAEPYRLLAQFYARRVTAIDTAARAETTAGAQARSSESSSGSGEKSFEPPTRRDRPIYPPEAKAAGIEGVVIVEIEIDEMGNVADARVVRSVPLLDEEALRAVREWKFVPAVVDGKPQRVRMTTTVNFTSR